MTGYTNLEEEDDLTSVIDTRATSTSYWDSVHLGGPRVDRLTKLAAYGGFKVYDGERFYRQLQIGEHIIHSGSLAGELPRVWPLEWEYYGRLVRLVNSTLPSVVCIALWFNITEAVAESLFVASYPDRDSQVKAVNLFIHNSNKPLKKLVSSS